MENNNAAGKYILDNHQLTAAGMRKLTRNWENCLNRIDRASDGQLMLRRSSDSSETSAGSNDNNPLNGNDIIAGIAASAKRSGSATSSSSGGSRSTDSLEQRAPWKPY